MDEYLAHLIALKNSEPMITLLFISVLDIILGYAKAFALKVVDSSVGTVGIMKHILMVTVPMLIYPLFVSAHQSGIWTMFVISILVSNAVSAVENWIQMGLPFPAALKDYFSNNGKKLEQTLLSERKKADKDEKTK